MAYSRPFSTVNRHDAAIVGGKGASLGEMTQAGIPVPPGFVVTADAFAVFLAAADLSQEIDAALSAVDHRTVHTVEAASERIRGLIEAADIPEDIAAEIRATFTDLGAPLVAVRSSATAEDGAEHAWAGQLESYLNVGEGDLLARVRSCWASLFTPRAIAYRHEKNLADHEMAVAVVVQKMVESEVSGVAFSVHPVTRDKSKLIIEAVHGLGDALVSGRATPDSYVVQKDTLATVDTKLSGQTPTLDGAQVRLLSEIILSIESHYGFPCDIEWAYAGGSFYVVQSRPITTLGFSNYRLIFASDGFVVMNVFNLLKAGYVRGGGALMAEHNSKVSLYIKDTDLDYYGKIGYELFSSKEKTKQLVDDISALLRDISLVGEIHTAKAGEHSTEELVEGIEEIGALANKFISLYGLLESHYTFYTENLITAYANLNNEGLKGKTVFDVIFKESGSIKDQKVRDTCENVATLARFKFSTKEAMGASLEGISALVREARKRFGLRDAEDVRILSLEEIQYFLKNGFRREEFDRKVEDRKDWFLVLADREGTVETFSGEEARKRIDEIKRKSILETTGESSAELKGQTASLGVCTGRAVVIPYIRTTEDEAYRIALSEFRQGDVLVTKNSVPEIMEIIKKAGAIVTEEGGITCHGAIMSREFQVPGIVGVDRVVDLIKTGDVVEVDARSAEGVIRVLNRSQP